MRLRYWQPRRELSPLPIRLDPAAQNAGLAPRLINLIQGNVARHPERRNTFDRMRGTVAIRAIDANVAATLEFLDGKLLVHDGSGPTADLVISGDRRALLELPNTGLRFGLPDITDPLGRSVIWRMLCRSIRVGGRALLVKPMLLPRLMRLLSAADSARTTKRRGRAT